jgi:predicted dehydrogenase
VWSGTDSDPLRVAVIGCGHFGRFHAAKYAAHPGARLVALVDSDPDAATRLAAEHGATALTDPGRLIGLVDACSVVVPTASHFDIAAPLLDAGLHVLIEKPIATSSKQANALINFAKQQNVVLQVGHLERFNAALLALQDAVGQPRFIESHRIAPFKPRNTDVDVILDLMIHDIDLIQHLVDSPLESIDAIGVPVLTGRDDIANARQHFENGAVANVTSSRVSLKSERKMRLFQPDAYISIDFQGLSATVARRGEGEMFPGVPKIDLEQRRFEANDPLALEIDAFLAAIRGEQAVAVTGEVGLRALESALRINAAMQRPLL